MHLKFKLITILLFITAINLFSKDQEYDFIEINFDLTNNLNGEKILTLNEGELYLYSALKNKNFKLSNSNNSIIQFKFDSQSNIALVGLTDHGFDSNKIFYVYKIDFNNGKVLKIIENTEVDQNLRILSINPNNTDQLLYKTDQLYLYTGGNDVVVPFDFNSYYKNMGPIIWGKNSFIIECFGEYEGSASRIYDFSDLKNKIIIESSLTTDDKSTTYYSKKQFIGYKDKYIIQLVSSDSDQDYSGFLILYDEDDYSIIDKYEITDIRGIFMSNNNIYSYIDMFSDLMPQISGNDRTLYILENFKSNRLVKKLNEIPKNKRILGNTTKVHNEIISCIIFDDEDGQFNESVYIHNDLDKKSYIIDLEYNNWNYQYYFFK